LFYSSTYCKIKPGRGEAIALDTMMEHQRSTVMFSSTHSYCGHQKPVIYSKWYKLPVLIGLEHGGLQSQSRRFWEGRELSWFQIGIKHCIMQLAVWSLY
jgi:hypothetical protein